MSLRRTSANHVEPQAAFWDQVVPGQLNLVCGSSSKGGLMYRASSLIAVVVVLIGAACSAVGADKRRIIDLTDTIRVGLVEQTAGRAMIEKYGIHEVVMEPEMNFKVTTGRSTFLGISTGRL